MYKSIPDVIPAHRVCGTDVRLFSAVNQVGHGRLELVAAVGSFRVCHLIQLKIRSLQTAADINLEINGNFCMSACREGDNKVDGVRKKMRNLFWSGKKIPPPPRQGEPIKIDARTRNDSPGFRPDSVNVRSTEYRVKCNSFRVLTF